jgi:hypothetical protein
MTLAEDVFLFKRRSKQMTLKELKLYQKSYQISVVEYTSINIML